jgi:hypothetical protein
MWNIFCGVRPKTPKSGKMTTCRPSTSLILIIFLLLLLVAGDIHPNPGPEKRNGQMDICHVNARSLMTYDAETCSYLKFEEIESYLIHDMKADIVCVSETWLDQTISDADIEIPNFTIHRNDRNRHGGGVATYVSNNLAVSRRIDLEYQDIESLWLEITTNKKTIMLATYYRPPISHGHRTTIVDNFVRKLIASLSSAIASN